jgi:hypothetical protein
MHRSIPVRALAAAALAGGLFAASAASAQEPDATIHFGGGSIAFIGSLQWGGGTLHYKGRSVPLRVTGIGIGAIGAELVSAEGTVWHLHHLSDINGTYAAVNANATAGAGSGEIDMRNEHGVEIRAHATSAGLNLSLAPTGVQINIK